MENKLNRISGIAYDWDGVFYAYDTIPNIQDVWAHAAASTIQGLIPNISFNDAKQIHINGYNQHGDVVTGATEFAQNIGYDAFKFSTSLLRGIHREILKKLACVAPQIFIPDDKEIEAFQICKNLVKNGIASHSCSTEWLAPFLHAKALTEFIEPNAIFGLEDGGFVLKHNNPKLVEMCFNALATPQRERAFIEDTARNLKTAKEIDPSLVTIFIHHGRPLQNLPSYIDFQFPNVKTFKNALYTAKTQPKIMIA